MNKETEKDNFSIKNWQIVRFYRLIRFYIKRVVKNTILSSVLAAALSLLLVLLIFLVTNPDTAKDIFSLRKVNLDIIQPEDPPKTGRKYDAKIIYDTINIADNFLYDFGETEEASTESSHIYKKADTYKVTVTHKDFPKLAATITIKVKDEPIFDPAKYILTKLPINEPLKINVVDLPKEVDIYRWYKQRTVDPAKTNKYLIEDRLEFEIPEFVWTQPGNYRVVLEAITASGKKYSYEYFIAVDSISTEEVVGKTGGTITQPPITSTRHYKLFKNYDQLSESLTILANKGTSRTKKKRIVKKIENDAASIDILVNDSKLEDYLMKIQLEANSRKKNIKVTNLKRNGDNKIISIITDEN